MYDDLKTVYDVEYIKEQIMDIFPDAIRGSVAKSNWGRKRKQLHLEYYILCDTVGGLVLEAKGNLFYLYEWDTNQVKINLFAESDIDDMINRIRKTYGNNSHIIERTVKF